MDQTNSIKYQYIRDPENYERVLTIARRMQRTESQCVFTFSYSMNRPSCWKHDNSRHHEVKIFERGDQFSRKMARKITNGRLESPNQTLRGKRHLEHLSFTLVCEYGGDVVSEDGSINQLELKLSILKVLESSKNKICSRIARSEGSRLRDIRRSRISRFDEDQCFDLPTSDVQEK
jgi:hypothetical protein